MRIAYADPPYVGQAHRYKDQPEYSGEIDHEELIQRLVQDYPDGWALSCTSQSLAYLLPLCPPRSRVAAWVKPFHAYKRNVRPAYAWEPVIYWGGRNPPWYPHPPPPLNGKATTPKDFVAANITLKKGLTGAKPEKFSLWLFWLMGMIPGDEFVDLFPGTGGVSDAWLKYQAEYNSADD